MPVHLDNVCITLGYRLKQLDEFYLNLILVNVLECTVLIFEKKKKKEPYETLHPRKQTKAVNRTVCVLGQIAFRLRSYGGLI